MALKYWYLLSVFLVYPSNQQQNDSGIGSLIDQIYPSPPPGCICVAYYLCQNGTLIKDGRGVIDVRLGDDDVVIKKPCPGSLDVCCNESEKLKEPIKPKEPDIVASECGHRNSHGVGFRIIGNDEAQFGEFPWMVAIQENGDYRCGGSLIHPQVVLTGAHCVIDKDSTYIVRAGEWDSKTTKENFPHQDLGVKDIITHPDYNSGNLYNDIALLILNSSVTIQENVNIICLPSQNEVIDAKGCYVNGWGKNNFKSKSLQTILKKVKLPIVPNDQCQEALRMTRLGSYFELHESFLCAGGEAGKDACNGDGGSPLVCPVAGTDVYQQVGIVSWGIGCGTAGIPGVYANVAKFRNWIDDHMALNNFKTDGYNPPN